MKNYYYVLKKCPLFSGIDNAEFDDIIKKLAPAIKKYEKNEFIFSPSDTNIDVGIVLKGNVSIIKEDFWGNRAILAKINESEIFGETFAFIKQEKLPVSVIANEIVEILFMDFKKIIKDNREFNSFQSKFISNIIKILANKNIMLTQKIEHLVKRTTKEKVLSYLSSKAQKVNSNSFDIPFNRQELADYLSVDRSALSKVLCELKEIGMLDFNKNHFKLLH